MVKKAKNVSKVKALRKIKPIPKGFARLRHLVTLNILIRATTRQLPCCRYIGNHSCALQLFATLSS